MKKLICAAIAAALTVGCASVTPSRGLSAYPGVKLEPADYGAQHVAGVDFTRPKHGKSGRDISFCVAQFVSNRSVSITDQSRSFVGQYTGNYYQINSGQTVAGGEVISHASADGAAVVANGSEGYRVTSLGMPVERVIRFKLTAEPTSSGYRYRFSELEAAQLSTGAVQNTGFSLLYAHEAAQPEPALQALERLTQKIDDCL